MTSYHGGKQRIGKKLANEIYIKTLAIEDESGFIVKGYCEPFCGMLGVYRHIPKLFEDHSSLLNYKAGDANTSVIMMWKEAKTGWVPPNYVTETTYNQLKNSSDSAEKGFVGHQYSFGGANFKGYGPKYGKTIDASQSIKRIRNISDELYNVSFSSGYYTQYTNLKNYVIYCDPPYESTQQKYAGSFNSNNFYNWCKEMSKNNIVFVSGYDAPNDFECIFSKSNKLTGVNTRQKIISDRNRIEKLFVLN